MGGGTATHAEIRHLIDSESEADRETVKRYLEEMADAFSIDEVFEVIALVDTPDVFD